MTVKDPEKVATTCSVGGKLHDKGFLFFKSILQKSRISSLNTSLFPVYSCKIAAFNYPLFGCKSASGRWPLVSRDPTLLLSFFFFEEGAVFCARSCHWRSSAPRPCDEAQRPLLSASCRSFLPRVQWAPCGPTPRLFSAVYLFSVAYYSRRKRKGENNNNNPRRLASWDRVSPSSSRAHPPRRGAAFHGGNVLLQEPRVLFFLNVNAHVRVSSLWRVYPPRIQRGGGGTICKYLFVWQSVGV